MESASNNRLDSSILAAWHEQIAQATSLKPQLVQRQSELLPRFTKHYQALTSLPRRMRRGLQRRWKHSLAGIALLMALGAQPALAATINVRGDCNLASAIRAANSDTARRGCPAGNEADTIVLPSGSTQTLTRIINADYGPTGLPLILSEITIDGSDSTIRRTRSAPSFRILSVANTGDLTLTNTTVSGGRAADEGAPRGTSGGGVLALGALTLTNATISSNSAEFGGGVLAYDGVVDITRSTISDNRATSDNGAGGVSGFDSDISITTSTISGNAGRGIGGIYGDLEVTYSTISNNNGDGVAYFGGNVSLTNSTVSGNTRGIFISGEDTSTTLELTHTTVTRNAREGILAFGGQYGVDIDLNRSLISGNGRLEVSVQEEAQYALALVDVANFNVFGSSGNANVEGFEPGSTDIVPRRPLSAILNPNLADNGGPTRTHALPVGSPAIDAVFDGTCPPPDEDQRGVDRLRDGNRDGGPACDTGAFER